MWSVYPTYIFPQLASESVFWEGKDKGQEGRAVSRAVEEEVSLAASGEETGGGTRDRNCWDHPGGKGSPGVPKLGQRQQERWEDGEGGPGQEIYRTQLQTQPETAKDVYLWPQAGH